MDYELYDTEIHRLFEQAFVIRSQPDSSTNELCKADKNIEAALHLCAQMEQTAEYVETAINHRLRCFIERLAIHSRLLKAAYQTPAFDKLSKYHETLCLQYCDIRPQISNIEIEQSLHQLTIMAYQSLAANYFRQGGMGTNKELCLQAIEFLGKAIALAQGESICDILINNKLQIQQSIKNE